MLTEQFIASIGTPLKPPGTNVAKDAAIFVHELRPTAAQRSIFKKSATSSQGLAVSATHIFAAQVDKAVVHVYSRERGSQEATVPFPERITSLCLACDDSVLILGTVEGRIFAWEVASGRLVATGQVHLQAITALSIDIESAFLFSASRDSAVHVWSITDLLAFTNVESPSPARTFSLHRSDVIALAVGHGSPSSSNFVISAAKDKTCLIWDPRTAEILRTYLLPAVPTCLTIDAADRAFYVGYEDGSVQQIDLYLSAAGSLHAVQNGESATNPVQPRGTSLWKLPDLSHGTVLSLALSFDGTTLLTGHQSGSILTWDVGRGSFLAMIPHTPLPGPVSCLQTLPITGYDQQRRDNDTLSTCRVHEITKPKFGAYTSGNSEGVPGNYALNVHFTSDLPIDEQSTAFTDALTATSFSASLLDEGLAELASWNKTKANQSNGRTSNLDNDADFLALDEDSAQSSPSLQQENDHLRQQIAALQRVQMKSLETVQRLSEEKQALMQRGRARRSARGHGREEAGSDVEMDSSDDDSG